MSALGDVGLLTIGAGLVWVVGPGWPILGSGGSR